MSSMALSRSLALRRTSTGRSEERRERANFVPEMTPLLQCVRLSSSPPVTNDEKFGTHLEMRTIQSDPHLTRLRPLVVLYGWMNGKKRHLDKYGNLYLSKGFDVLTIQVPPSKIIRPKLAQQVMDKVLEILGDSSQSQKPLMIHGFSVGGYLYGELLVKLQENKEKFEGIRERMTGQIFDSPVDFEGVPRGFANVLGFNKVSKAVIKSSIESYLKLFKNISTKHYIRSSAAFHDNDLRLPSLLLYSRADPIGVADIIELVARKWEQKGIPVHLKCWENSPHVSHFHRHPDEYVDAILAFLEEIRLSAPEAQESVIQEKKAIKEAKTIP